MRLRCSTTTIAIYFLFTILCVTLFTHGSCFKKEEESFCFCKKKVENIEKKGSLRLITMEKDENMQPITKQKDENMQLMNMSEYVLNEILACLDLRDAFTKFNLLSKKFQNLICEFVNEISPKFHEEMKKLPEHVWIKKLMTNFNIDQIHLFQKQLSSSMKIKHNVLGMGGLSSDGVFNWETGQAREKFPTLKNVKLIKSCENTVLVLHESDQRDRSVSIDWRRQRKTKLNDVKSIFVNPFHGKQFICLTYDGSLFCRDETVHTEPAIRKMNIPTQIQNEIYKRGVKEIFPLYYNHVFGIYFQDRSFQIWDIKESGCIFTDNPLQIEIKNVKQIEYVYWGIVALDDNDDISVYYHDGALNGSYVSKEKIRKHLTIENLCGKENTIKVEEMKVSKYLAARFSNGQVILWYFGLFDRSFNAKGKPILLPEPLSTFCSKGVDKIFVTKSNLIALKKYTQNGLFCCNMYNLQQEEIYEDNEEKKHRLKTNWIEDVYQRSERDFIVIFKNKEIESLTFYL